MKQLLLLFTIGALAIGCANNTKQAAETPVSETLQAEENNTASAGVLPSFSMRDQQGRLVSLQNLKGKKLFVNLWATWCPPCRQEMPSIAKLYASVDTSKVAFVMLSLDDRFEKAVQYVAKNRWPFPVYYPAENLPELFNVPGIPSTFIFDENGRLLKKIEGSENYNTDGFRKLFR